MKSILVLLLLSVVAIYIGLIFGRIGAKIMDEEERKNKDKEQIEYLKQRKNQYRS